MDSRAIRGGCNLLILFTLCTKDLLGVGTLKFDAACRLRAKDPLGRPIGALKPDAVCRRASKSRAMRNIVIDPKIKGK